MSSNILVATHNVIYKPGFDENSGRYIDISPYQRYGRNCQVYECRCRAGARFRGNVEFKQHIKSKTHEDFIRNYPKYFKEVDEAADRFKELRIVSERKIKKLEREKVEIKELVNSQIRGANSKISSLIGEKEVIEIEMTNLKNKLQLMEKEKEALKEKNIELEKKLEKDMELKTKILRRNAKMAEMLNELGF